MLVTRNGIPAPAFFMGALKHRDITGAEISSQVRAIHVLILDNK